MKKIFHKNYKLYLCRQLTNLRNMEFYIDDKEVEEIFQQIFKEVMIFRNGETHHEMRKFGLQYQKSLGATIVNLRELAAQYENNHLLAHKLWTKEFRETKILATLLEEANEVNAEQLERWFSEMDTNELLEQACMNLFVNLPKVEEYIFIWLKSEEYRKVICAVMTLRHLAMHKELQNRISFENLIVFLPTNIDEQYLRNQLKRCLGKLVRLNKNLAEGITQTVRDRKAGDENWQEVWDDLKYELEI